MNLLRFPQPRRRRRRMAGGTFRKGLAGQA
jgi:hypothetical protein